MHLTSVITMLSHRFTRGHVVRFQTIKMTYLVLRFFFKQIYCTSVPICTFDWLKLNHVTLYKKRGINRRVPTAIKPCIDPPLYHNS